MYIEPDVVPLLGRRSELHFPKWCRNDNTVLVETRREGIWVKHGADTFYVCYTGKTLSL